MSANTDVPPEEDIKPQICNEDAVLICAVLYGLEVSALTELNSYDDRNYHIISPRSTNPHVQPVSPDGYVLKVTNTLDSKDLAFFEGQNEVMLLLRQHDIAAPTPIKNLSGEYFSQERLPNGHHRRVHVVRLFQFQPGKILKSVPATFQLYYQVGVWLARLNNALGTFRHAGLDYRLSMWHLKSSPIVKSYISYVPDPNQRALVTQVINQFIEKIVPRMEQLPSGIIHGDLNEQNILVSEHAGQWRVSAILDFGDMNLAPYVCDVAAAMCYMMLDAPRNGLDILQVGGQTLAGYQSLRPLSKLELSLLKIAVCSRICQSLVLGLYTQSLQPDNLYITDTQANGWAVLTQLWGTSDVTLAEAWAKAR